MSVSYRSNFLYCYLLFTSLLLISLLLFSLPFSSLYSAPFLFFFTSLLLSSPLSGPVIWENVAIPKSQVIMRSYITNVGLIIGQWDPFPLSLILTCCTSSCRGCLLPLGSWKSIRDASILSPYIASNLITSHHIIWPLPHLHPPILTAWLSLSLTLDRVGVLVNTCQLGQLVRSSWLLAWRATELPLRGDPAHVPPYPALHIRHTCEELWGHEVRKRNTKCYHVKVRVDRADIRQNWFLSWYCHDSYWQQHTQLVDLSLSHTHIAAQVCSNIRVRHVHWYPCIPHANISTNVDA